MASNMKYVRQLLQAAKSEGFTFVCFYDTPEDYDYRGRDINEAIKALEACEVMHLALLDGERTIGSALIIPYLDQSEVIADYSGTFINEWWNKTVAPAL